MCVPTIGIVCDLCDRRERFDVEALKREHGGEVKMPELLSRLVARLSEAASVQRL